jgi:hypothetical protein
VVACEVALPDVSDKRAELRSRAQALALHAALARLASLDACGRRAR